MIVISQKILDAMAKKAKETGNEAGTVIQECPKPMTVEDYMRKS